MKVTLPKNYREIFTLDDLDRAKMVIAYERENDEDTPKGWAAYAVREALNGSNDWLEEVLTATAEIAFNGRVWNAYGDDTHRLDVWIEATARTSEGFLIVGSYLSDIWGTTSEPSYKEHQYIRRFKEVRE